jgi:hypothetical protein
MGAAAVWTTPDTGMGDVLVTLVLSVLTKVPNVALCRPEIPDNRRFETKILLFPLAVAETMAVESKETDPPVTIVVT